MKTAFSRRLISFLLLTAPLYGEQPPPDDTVRPRVGLVLSGGAARGSAHIGVLKVLEEMRIPVDFVGGTSMGAMIAGLYAAGVSPSEMESILAETDWRDLLDDRLARRRLPFRRKVDDQAYLAQFELGFNRGSFQIPSGLISGQKLGFALQLMALRIAGIDDFDHLPIPFRAVATDLETGEMVVLGEGDLGQAIRASMSLPAIFTPIEIDDRILVDGGLVRNLPVDVVQELGADFIIAVDVGEPLFDRERLGSIAKVTNQMTGMQIHRNVQEQAALADILIKPQLEGFGSSEFARGIEMVPRGEEATRALQDQLGRLSVSEEEFQAYRRRLDRTRPPEGARLSGVQLTSSSTADPAFVFRQIQSRTGDTLNLDHIRRDLESLYETGDYERVDFRLVKDQDDYVLLIEAIDKSWGPNFLRFGLNFFADFEGESSFDVLASYTMTRLNKRRAEFKLQAQLGENPSLVGEFYQPLSREQTWFTALRLSQSTSTDYLPVGEGTFVPYRSDYVELGWYLGYQMGSIGEMRVGLAHGSLESQVRNRVEAGESPSFPLQTESEFAGYRATLLIDQFDNMNFPQNGFFVVADYFGSREHLESDQDYDHLVGFLGLAGTRGRHTLLSLSNLYSALGSDSPVVSDLGGLFRLSGVPRESVLGRYGGNLSLLYLYRLMDLPLGLGGSLYLGGSLEAGNLWETQDEVSLNDLRYSGSLNVGADTIFGPVYLALGVAEGGDSALYFFVGRTF